MVWKNGAVSPFGIIGIVAAATDEHLPKQANLAGIHRHYPVSIRRNKRRADHCEYGREALEGGGARIFSEPGYRKI